MRRAGKPGLPRLRQIPFKPALLCAVDMQLCSHTLQGWEAHYHTIGPCSNIRSFQIAEPFPIELIVPCQPIFSRGSTHIFPLL